MTRRDFIVLAQGLGLSTWFGDMAFAQANVTPVIRKSATTAAAAADVETLRKGVAALIGVTEATQYASWMYWANSHGTPDPIPPAMKSVWYKCQHSPPLNLKFFPWHRAYLYFFEALIRETTQNASFALPYWDWYASTEIPLAFTGEGNSLNWTQRHISNRTLLKTALGRPTFAKFSDLFERNPHGTVHIMVGGDMHLIETSARDPVFWAHHCNVDRLWSVWLAADTNHVNPTDETWKKEAFAFDVAGQKRLTVGQVLKTEDLGYKYDNLQAAGTNDAVPPRPTNVQTAAPVSGFNLQGGAQPQLLSGARQLGLTSSLDQAMKIPPAARERVSIMATQPADSWKLAVVLQGLQITDAGRKRGFEYRLYLNLPEQPSAEDNHDDFFVDVVNSFQLSHHTNEATILVLPIEKLAPALARKGHWNSGEVNIAFITDDKEAKDTLLTISHIGLVIAESTITPETVRSVLK